MAEVGPSTVVGWKSCAFSMRTMAKNWVNAYSNVVREANYHDRGAKMHYSRIALAALGATVAYFVLGGILFSALPSSTCDRPRRAHLASARRLTRH
jgi:hypothetical protein